MTIIYEFITANLDRIERTAREATPGSWEATTNEASMGGRPNYRIGNPRAPMAFNARMSHADASHIAAHDPAQVLAWVAGLRAVVEMHAPLELCDHEGCTPTCAVCNEGDVAAETDYYANWPCPTLRALAGIFADQPGYDEEWR